jgi:hypothetical protein
MSLVGKSEAKGLLEYLCVERNLFSLTLQPSAGYGFLVHEVS